MFQNQLNILLLLPLLDEEQYYREYEERYAGEPEQADQRGEKPGAEQYAGSEEKNLFLIVFVEEELVL